MDIESILAFTEKTSSVLAMINSLIVDLHKVSEAVHREVSDDSRLSLPLLEEDDTIKPN